MKVGQMLYQLVGWKKRIECGAQDEEVNRRYGRNPATTAGDLQICAISKCQSLFLSFVFFIIHHVNKFM